MVSLQKSLYKKLLAKAARFDKYPGLKSAFQLPEEWQKLLGFGQLHNPCLQDAKWVKLVRGAFLTNGGSIQQGFAALKVLTDVETNAFNAIYGAAQLPAGSQPVTPPTALVTHKKWVTPLKILSDRLGPANSTAVAVSGPTRGRPGTFLHEGAVLLAHPMLRENPFRKAVLLVLRIHNDVVHLVLLNDSQYTDPRFRVDVGNHFFPPELHGQPVYWGGQTVFRSFPPHSNVHFLHHRPELPHARELVRDGEAVLFCSGTADLQHIGQLIRGGHAHPAEFRTLWGTFEEQLPRVVSWLKAGYFIPADVAPLSLTYLQNHSRGGDMWDAVLQELGGEFDHMRLTTKFSLST